MPAPTGFGSPASASTISPNSSKLGGWVLPPDRPWAAVAGELHRYTNGNPFFLSQIMEMWPDRNGSNSGPRRSGSVVSGIPSAVQEVVRARINRLPESVQIMLSAAAVVGSAIPLELLRRLTEAGASTDLVLNAVDVGTAGGLLIERAAGQFAFAHDLVHEHLYASLGPARRLKLHLSVARALESLAGEDRGSGSPRLPLRHGCATRRGCARSRLRHQGVEALSATGGAPAGHLPAGAGGTSARH